MAVLFANDLNMKQSLSNHFPFLWTFLGLFEMFLVFFPLSVISLLLLVGFFAITHLRIQSSQLQFAVQLSIMAFTF